MTYQNAQFKNTGNDEGDVLNFFNNTLRSLVQKNGGDNTFSTYTEDFHEIYLGLKLCKWIDIYKYFKSFAIKNITKAFVKLNIEQLRNGLSEHGFSLEEINVIEKYLIFSKSSRDLFDSFMIKFENVIYFIPRFYNFIDASRAMISLFGGDKPNSAIGNKGVAFEQYINNLLVYCKKMKVERNISANDQGESYEIDIVFQLDNILFFCECKTISIS